MNITIIGAGLAGLSTALSLTHSPTTPPHSITLLESASTLNELGAGVQLTPIATRQFLSWGLLPSLLAASALPKAWYLRRGADGEVLNRVEMERFEEWYGAPYVVVHRADLHRILHEAVVRRGVRVRLGARVEEYGVEEGWVRLVGGERLEADLVVACDGINSLARRQLLTSLGQEWKGKEMLEETGWAAYRLMADVDDVKNDPLTSDIVAEHAGNCWAEANKSIMTYMIRDSGKLNLVLSHPDNINTSTWTRDQYLTELHSFYSTMDPRARRLISLSSGPITNWPVHQVAKLPTWISQSGRFALIGDAAHAMAFYLSMGVSLAIEDAAALATALDLHTSHPTDVSLAQAMKVFEKVRKPRAEKIRDASLHAGAMLHLPAGGERELRDESARQDCAVEGARRGGDALVEWVSYGITDRVVRGLCYGYDVVDEIFQQARRDGLVRGVES